MNLKKKKKKKKAECRLNPNLPIQIFWGSFFFRATPAAYGSFQARGQLRAGAMPQLQHLIQPTTRPRIEPTSLWILVGFLTC